MKKLKFKSEIKKIVYILIGFIIISLSFIFATQEVFALPFITNRRAHIQTVANHPFLADGWYVRFRAWVDDPLGVPGNITSVVVNELTGNDGDAPYYLNWDSTGNRYARSNLIDTFLPGDPLTYQFIVTNAQNETDTITIDRNNTIQLDVIPNLNISGPALTPTFTFDTINFGEDYSIRIAPTYNNGSEIYNSGWVNTSTPSFTVPDGILDSGESYYFKAVARASNDYNQSLNIIGYTAAPVPEPATLILLGSGLVGLVGFRRRLKRS
ncbi:PEP-CTERM sorting domain-containing protein [Thermodesulfobacteriota bacterium]